jgi:hypothetical protein
MSTISANQIKSTSGAARNVDSLLDSSQLSASSGAGMVGFSPTGTITSTTVQAAIAEVGTELATSISTISTNLAASSGSSLVGYIPAGDDAVATTVQAQLREIAYRGNNLTVFGDSFTYGVIGETGAYSTENYANYISRATGLPITNKAISGGLIIDLGSNIYNTATSSDDVFLTMTGYNDGRVYGSSDNGLLTYRGVLRAMLVWLALPDSAKLLANSASISYTGTWATLSTVYSDKSTSKYTNTNVERYNHN